MFAELLLVATLVASEQEKIEKDDRYVTDRITKFVSSRSNHREARCAIQIAYKESRYNKYATNGKYWGIYQLGFAHPTKPKDQSISRQLRLANDYVLARYGNWCNAWLHHIKHNWY
jgi:hypothetical protein